MIVNPVMYGGAAETCSGTIHYNGSVSGQDLKKVAAKNSILLFRAFTSIRDDAFSGLTTILDFDSGRIRVLRVDSDFHIGYP